MRRRYAHPRMTATRSRLRLQRHALGRRAVLLRASIRSSSPSTAARSPRRSTTSTSPATRDEEMFIALARARRPRADRRPDRPLHRSRLRRLDGGRGDARRGPVRRRARAGGDRLGGDSQRDRRGRRCGRDPRFDHADRLAGRRAARQAASRVLPHGCAPARRRGRRRCSSSRTPTSGFAAAKAAGARVVGLTRTLGAERLAAADELVERIDVPLLERLAVLVIAHRGASCELPENTLPGLRARDRAGRRLRRVRRACRPRRQLSS